MNKIQLRFLKTKRTEIQNWKTKNETKSQDLLHLSRVALDKIKFVPEVLNWASMNSYILHFNNFFKWKLKPINCFSYFSRQQFQYNVVVHILILLSSWHLNSFDITSDIILAGNKISFQLCSFNCNMNLFPLSFDLKLHYDEQWALKVNVSQHETLCF